MWYDVIIWYDNQGEKQSQGQRCLHIHITPNNQSEAPLMQNFKFCHDTRAKWYLTSNAWPIENSQ